MSIQQPKADIKMTTKLPKVEIHTEPVKVQIDQYPCRAEIGFKNYIDLTKDTASFAKQKAMEGIARIVRQGNEMAAIQNKTDVIPEQAEENAYHLFDKEFNFDLIPKSRPKIDFIGGKVDIKPIEGKVNMDVGVNKPIIDYKMGKVDIYLRQKNSINIEYVGGRFNQLG
ncbi:hypothetical protein KVH43_07105 [Crassaminicella indica]|uniref:Uncharacterized protein n=2 Tax=Crassaminicella indica TaxID=2855394 RepID=A0ABX8RI54_9CLOT|nr:hypothetical protein KVH43_07105 [Crassaminicella indica]